MTVRLSGHCDGDRFGGVLKAFIPQRCNVLDSDWSESVGLLFSSSGSDGSWGVNVPRLLYI